MIAVHSAKPMVVAKFAAAIGWAFDFGHRDFDVVVDFDLGLAERAMIGRGRLDPVKFGAKRLKTYWRPH